MCVLKMQRSAAPCVEGETWGCDYENGKLWATQGCRLEVTYAKEKVVCGEGQDKSIRYECDLPDIREGEGRMSEQEKAAMKSGMQNAVADVVENITFEVQTYPIKI